MVCVLNTTGRARLLACAACGELARCERCEAAVNQPAEERFVCRRLRRPSGRSCAWPAGPAGSRRCGPACARLRDELGGARAAPDAGGGGDRRDERRTAARRPGVRGHRGRAAPGRLGRRRGLPRRRRRAARPRATGPASRPSPCWPGRPAWSAAGPAAGACWCRPRLPHHEVLQAVLLRRPGPAGPHRAGPPGGPRLPAGHGHGGGERAGGARVRRGASDTRRASRSSARPTAAGCCGPPTTSALCDALARTVRPAGRVRVEVDPLRV